MNQIEQLQKQTRIIGTFALLISLIFLFMDREQFFRSYLFAYMFCLGIALGSMAILFIYHLAGGAWGAVSRRIMEATTRLLPIFAVLFLPIAFGMHSLYEWTHSDVVNADEVLKAKSAYLNIPFFYIRAAIYFAIWILLAFILNKRSAQQDQTQDPSIPARLELIGGLGLVLYGLTMTFAAVDWVMSLDPHWFSTVFGLLLIAGQVLSAFAFVITIAVWLSKVSPYSEIISADQFHDLGKLLLAFVMIWAYLSFSQYLIIFSGNLPEENHWYVNRLQGAWRFVPPLLIIGHFALPFILLLSRTLKRNPRRLAIVAIGVMVMRLIDLYWLVAPDVKHVGFAAPLDFILPIGLGSLCLSLFLNELKKRPFFVLYDPNLPETNVHLTEAKHA
jgi:preprotein translocase subunit SecG